VLHTADDEARRLARSKLDVLTALPMSDLDAYGERLEEVVSGSGRRFRIESQAFWDMEPWASMMYVIVKVRAPHGWRRLWPLKESTTLLVDDLEHASRRQL
jgi:hypothetical protein